MNDEILPRMSADEWERGEYCVGDSGTNHILWHDRRLAVSSDRADVVVDFTGPDRAALAAAALHGQSFGFAHADVKCLRNAAYAVRLIGGEREASCLAHLAARIEALLPSTDARSSDSTIGG